ncbi:MAG: nucleoside hydrolase [Promicromonosporaceae bacterium]|nr:nucleoside hydrolase [Promicromonosporaceae bacterium]
MTRVPAPESIITHPKTWRLGEAPWRRHPFPVPGTRVIIDNDFSGDPDDLYQLVHHLLCPSVEISLVVASHLREGDHFDPTTTQAANATLVARDVFARMGITSTEVIVTGAEVGLADMNTPQPSAAAAAIIAEAMKDDDRPLFYAAGGGLTDLASAILIEPRVAERLTLVWIGGAEHAGLALPPVGAMPIEYNLLIDVTAARVCFETQALTIWQVPRDTYRQCLMSDAELRLRVATRGELGEWLYGHIAELQQRISNFMPVSETYPMGDQPLVLLTALRSIFEPDPTSSFYVQRPTPQITADGAYRQVQDSRLMRIYTQVDLRLVFEDFFLKLEEFTTWQAV